MKQIKFGFIFSLLTSSSVFSANPVPGWYFGLLGQLSHAPNETLNVTFDGVTFPTGNVNLSPVGGGVGASIGYNIINMVRVETEFLFNINNYGSLQIGPCTLISPNVMGPEGNCPTFIDRFHGGLGFNGNIMGFYGLLNGIYDFTSSDSENNFVPYLGVGFGASYLRNQALFKSNKYAPTPFPGSLTISSSNAGFALQGIVGFFYYLDDFATMGLDYRYISALRSNNGSTGGVSQYGINTINLTFTFALESGEQDP